MAAAVETLMCMRRMRCGRNRRESEIAAALSRNIQAAGQSRRYPADVQLLLNVRQTSARGP